MAFSEAIGSCPTARCATPLCSQLPRLNGPLFETSYGSVWLNRGRPAHPVLVGSTVRKPAGVATAAIEALLVHFADVGGRAVTPSARNSLAPSPQPRALTATWTRVTSPHAEEKAARRIRRRRATDSAASWATSRQGVSGWPLTTRIALVLGAWEMSLTDAPTSSRCRFDRMRHAKAWAGGLE